MVELIPLTLVIAYFIPFVVAAARDHDDFVPILLANAALGWTGIGWLAVLAWASLTPPHRRKPPRPRLRRVV